MSSLLWYKLHSYVPSVLNELSSLLTHYLIPKQGNTLLSRSPSYLALQLVFSTSTQNYTNCTVFTDDLTNQLSTFKYFTLFFIPNYFFFSLAIHRNNIKYKFILISTTDLLSSLHIRVLGWHSPPTARPQLGLTPLIQYSKSSCIKWSFLSHTCISILLLCSHPLCCSPPHMSVLYMFQLIFTSLSFISLYYLYFFFTDELVQNALSWIESVSNSSLLSINSYFTPLVNPICPFQMGTYLVFHLTDWSQVRQCHLLIHGVEKVPRTDVPPKVILERVHSMDGTLTVRPNEGKTREDGVQNAKVTPLILRFENSNWYRILRTSSHKIMPNHRLQDFINWFLKDDAKLILAGLCYPSYYSAVLNQFLEA